jgi:DNA-binding MarR family transcriptional regulator
MTYPHDVPSPAQTAEMTSALRIAIMRTARRLRAQRSDSSLGLGSLAALATLDREGPLTPGELADHERVQPPSMTRTVAALEAAGLVQRVAHPTDGRQVLLSLTEAAREMLKADRRRRDGWLAVRMAALTPDERATLADAAGILDRISRS